MSHTLVSIILPVHNQADHIGAVVRAYERALAGMPYAHELILVPNGCRDDSEAECFRVSREYADVRVIASAQGGWGLAVKAGLQHATGDLLCYTNSARTEARDLVLVLDYARNHPGTVVKAHRKIRENYQRGFGSRLFNLECRLLFGLSHADVNGTPKVFPRAFTSLLRLTRDDDLIDAEFCAVCRRAGYPMLEVPIFNTARHGGRSTTGYRSAVKMYTGAFQLWRTLRQ